MQDRDASIDRTIAQLVQQYEAALCTYLAGLTGWPRTCSWRPLGRCRVAGGGMTRGPGYSGWPRTWP